MLGKREWWSWRTLAFAWLILATVIAAAASFRGLVPIDARSGQAVQGLDARFEFPAVGAALEPLMAPAHIVLGAPDIRIAAFSTCAWLLVVTGVAAFWLSEPPQPQAGPWQTHACNCVQGDGRRWHSRALYPLRLHVPAARPVAGREGPRGQSSPTCIRTRFCRTTPSSRCKATSPIIAIAATPWSASPIIIPRSGRRMPSPPARCRAPEIVRGVELRFWNSAQRRSYLLALGLRQGLPFPYRNYRPAE